LRELLAGQDTDHLAAAELLVKRLEEQLARLRIVLPGMLAIEREGDGPLLAGSGDAAEQILGRRLRLAARIAEADRVGELAVAEEDGELAAEPWLVVIAFALQLAALQVALVGGAAVHSRGGGDVERFRRERALGGPHSHRPGGA